MFSKADAMKQQTAEMEQMVRNAEAESEKVRLEKMSIMHRWTSSVINISKRDEALVSFRYFHAHGANPLKLCFSSFSDFGC